MASFWVFVVSDVLTAKSIQIKVKIWWEKA